MTAFATLLESLAIGAPPHRADSMPLGAAWLPDRRRGVDLGAHGYIEEEFLVSGHADRFIWDDDLRALALGPERFTTRVLVRRPLDPTRFSGGVQLEPHHPDEDRALTWSMIAPWIVRNGHAHVGVTYEPATVPDLIRFDGERYGTLGIPDGSQRWDIVGQVAAAVRTGRLPAFDGLNVRRIILSGWSMTGTFCRTFLGERFDERCRAGGAPVFDGYVICISSGGASRAGYAALRADARLAPDDPRRTIGPHGVPVVELLSEGESETHHAVLRPDDDAPEDCYRLYQVAGTGHIATGRPSLTTNRTQLTARGFDAPPREINEPPSDARMDLVAQAAFDAVDRWIADGLAAPRAGRFSYGDPSSEGIRGMMAEAQPLVRDGDGNVVGGVRTPWIEAPAAAYLPHSTPRPGRCLPAAHAPYSDPALLADLIAHMQPFRADEMERRYGTPEAYLERFERSARSLQAQRWLLEDGVAELLTDAAKARGAW